ncbi:DNA repair protein rad9 [Neolecta irregularis DAH-3]|uniref:DNA repair protein rad9 n=1 Tax=Neolecta irregularis (strain DAH-3) TaxID=1198029 RepID=A0A1U7LIU5_NEOID|nr:DNA repair protein rad9 [Neolecta irregularis DAH-3]|eukprot:OLL22548.1 DNA repair protein rad9 [Neolecta irregularis DAH-3]
MHAICDKNVCNNTCTINAKALKEYVDHFALKAEELNICVTGSKVVFTSFTEQIQSDKEVIKQPLHTVISLDTSEFETFSIQDNAQITFVLKEFRAIVQLAELLNVNLDCYFTKGGKPVLFEFNNNGLFAEFILATISDQNNPTQTTTSNTAMSNIQEGTQSMGSVLSSNREERQRVMSDVQDIDRQEKHDYQMEPREMDVIPEYGPEDHTNGDLGWDLDNQA